MGNKTFYSRFRNGKVQESMECTYNLCNQLIQANGNSGNDNSGNNGNGNSGNNGNDGNGNHYGWKTGNNGNGNSGNNGNGNSGANGNTSTGGTNDNNGNANNTGGSQNQNGILFPIEGEVSELEQEIIHMIKTTGKHKNYELIEYVNDVNREHAEVLMELNVNGYSLQLRK